MRDIDVFIKLLALPRPWTVDAANLDDKAKAIEIPLRRFSRRG